MRPSIEQAVSLSAKPRVAFAQMGVRRVRRERLTPADDSNPAPLGNEYRPTPGPLSFAVAIPPLRISQIRLCRSRFDAFQAKHGGMERLGADISLRCAWPSTGRARPRAGPDPSPRKGTGPQVPVGSTDANRRDAAAPTGMGVASCDHRVRFCLHSPPGGGMMKARSLI